MEKNEYTLKEYVCGYCNYKFQQLVRKIEGNVELYGNKAKNNTSSQVPCPRCGNFLKTWEDGTVLEILKLNKGIMPK